jgi:16S rRNA (adenine1518-N6/adenine1519-N6)-dimethyltransferase
MKSMRAKKSLGQHFLKSKTVVNTMIATANVAAGETVLEIGPGKGVLTEGLLKAGAKVIAIEKDSNMIALLEEKCAGEIAEHKLMLLNEDILDLRTEQISSPYKIIANIPYYITGAIIRKFLEAKNQPTSMTLLVQKEVADRIVARDGKESLLSISVKAYGVPHKIQKVKAELFSPPPNVDSAILHIAQISKDFFNETSEGNFFRILKAAFAHKRKFAVSNLQKEIGSIEWREEFKKADLPEKVRAEDIDLESWKKITSGKNIS